MSYTPSVKKQGNSWDICRNKVNIWDYELVSAVAYISPKHSFPQNVFDYCKCDMVLSFNPSKDKKWELCIFANSSNGTCVKNWIMEQIKTYNVPFVRLINN